MFIIFAGLPGTGKSTIAQTCAGRLGATYLRIDSIEQAIRSSGILGPQLDVGPAGYMAAYRVAADNLQLGHTVIADSVNPLRITREAFRGIAEKAQAGFLEVEVVCSDKSMHQQRVESRHSTVNGLVLPSWEEVETRHYESWEGPRLELDSARFSVAQCVERIVEAARLRPPR
ncbi:AAA family ATPase (plasmid) [Sinorhizobium medicae]|uniref:AAA family ATPase n=1 Tax=Sinorhizobium medicae TaxID=110321 RepID=UPI00036AFC10|nr:AAA family ATPase [Sinorhizobium medicae]MDX0693178.1 AAA family ATPase [Sinorhizobium medicae]MDX0742530.1 AAA family ATPase [Sinorhizobium medicae]MQX48222.1 AAA family ATPase [Sinorhizobium medicae]RVJ77875.1 adenylyl-sulfate kinase [Sinorhizobium medicae]WQO49260.1 AAA family ATPase [Sinorhizobium medicae]